mmetsp:Transcript_9103/g.30083  ORF Transcript_9103/g.30083 Transcript_9103/m.30083 type:complete len:157 (-) Transcript_9103:401-871(-)
MVQIISALARPAAAFVASGAAVEATPDLLQTHLKIGVSGRAAREAVALGLDAYLADDKRNAALAALERALGRTPAADAAGSEFSHGVLERGLRSRFFVFDSLGQGSIDMHSFAKLLQLLKADYSAEQLDAELMAVHVSKKGLIDYVDFVEWWAKQQ